MAGQDNERLSCKRTTISAGWYMTTRADSAACPLPRHGARRPLGQSCAGTMALSPLLTGNTTVAWERFREPSLQPVRRVLPRYGRNAAWTARHRLHHQWTWAKASVRACCAPHFAPPCLCARLLPAVAALSAACGSAAHGTCFRALAARKLKNFCLPARLAHLSTRLAFSFSYRQLAETRCDTACSAFSSLTSC